MKVTYDPEVDVLRIVLSDAPVEESDEEKPGVILDYDKDGNVVGMEILDAARRMEDKIDAQAIQDALRELRDGETVSLDDLRAELGI